MASERKSFPLRISKQIYADIRQWADEEMRSVNAQIEFLLREAVQQRKKKNRPKNLKESGSSKPD